MKRPVLILTLVTVVIVSFIPVTEKVQIKVVVKHDKPTRLPDHATTAQKKINKLLASRYAQAGWNWGKQQQHCAYLLFMHESKFDNYAKNMRGSTAYGIGQMLNEKSSDPTIQLLHAFRYISLRYGTPCHAYRFHRYHNWY